MSKEGFQQNVSPIIKGTSYFLCHVPSLVRHGSKPLREIGKDPALLKPVLDHLRPFEKAVAYPPNQVFIGNLDPDDLEKITPPWHQHLQENASRQGPFGAMITEKNFTD